MNPETFFENFDLLCEAPNGIEKLRELILQLAVMGKLVPQDPNDEPASVLLERIKAEKKRLIKEGKIKGSKQLLEISDNEVLFEIPDSWKWVRFDDICSYIQRGKSPKYVEESEFPVIAQKCIQWEGLKIDRAKFIDPLTIGKYEEERFLRTGDLLWNSTGTGTIGRVNVYVHEENTYDKVVADTHVTVVRPLRADSYYVFCWIASPMVQSNIENIASGSTNQIELATSTVKNHVLPLPPLTEQKRIVSKVDELMTLCDKLEARRQKKQELQSKLNSAALDRMLSAENQEEFEQYWQRICENFDFLYDNPENVEKLRQAILQLAVQGKLVEQDSEDEPASFLIKKINNEKINLTKKGKIKGTKSVSLEKTDNIPIFPENWELVNLDSIILFMDAGWSPACKNHPTEDEQTWGVLKTTSVQPLTFLWNEHKELPENLTPRPEYEVRAGDILITRAGPKNRVGICCLVKDTRSRLMISDKIIRFHLLDEFVFPEFIALCLNTGFSQSFIESQKSGMAESQMNISQNKLLMTPIPLPPLNEQKRIVEKVEQFMGLCDELESKLKKEREDGEKLMETVVRGLLEGAATEKSEFDKPILLQVASIQLK